MIFPPRRFNKEFFFCFIVSVFLINCGENRETLLVKATEFLQGNDVDSARACYESILKKHPFDPEAIQGMIDTARIRNATVEHVHWCRELLRLRPWDRDANVVYGKYLIERGELEDAVSRFILAYQDSEFKQEKQEVLDWVEHIRTLVKDSPSLSTTRSDSLPLPNILKEEDIK